MQHETDPYFKNFCEFCRSKDIPVAVLSDGFDAYIEPILKKEGLGWIPVYCNKLVFNGSGKCKPVFPYASESCECKCASCKRNSMLVNSGPGTVIVYIGDGYSDFCAASHADIVFAKKTLAAYCNENRIPHYPFSTFFDVQKILNEIIDKNKIRVRHQAFLARKKAFEIE